MLLPALSYYTLHYQAEPLLLNGTVLRSLSAIEFTEACELLLAWAQQHRCPFWLIDGRADVVQPLDAYEWLREDFLPRVYQMLGRIPYVAVVGQPEFWRALRARNYAPPPPIILSALARTNWFTTKAEALAWLAHFRPIINPG